MTINPFTCELYQKEQAAEIERIRQEIRKLPNKVRELIQQGEDVVDESIRFQDVFKKDNTSKFGVNVFNLNNNIPGDVMKYLVLLYYAAGYHDVAIQGGCWHGENGYYVKYPNGIVMKLFR